MRSFESHVNRRLDSRLESTPVIIKEAALRVEKQIAAKRIAIESFRGVPGYTDEEIDGDIKKSQALEKKFDSRNPVKETAKVLEACLSLQSKQLFGHEVEVIVPSSYDDFVNGVDVILAFKDTRGESTFAAAVDVTFGDVSGKFERALTDIENDTAGTIKYLDTGTYKGRKDGVPRLVIGLEQGSVRELAGLLVRGKLAEVTKHPLRRAIVEELHLEIKGFHAYAEARGKTNAAKVYKQALPIIERAAQNCRNIPYKTEDFDVEKDDSFDHIRQAMHIISPPPKKTGRVLESLH